MYNANLKLSKSMQLLRNDFQISYIYIVNNNTKVQFLEIKIASDGVLSLLVTGHGPLHPGVCHQTREPVPLQPVQQHPPAPLSAVPGDQVSDDTI